MPVNFVTMVKIFNLSIKRYLSLLHLPPTLYQHNFIFYYFKNWNPISGRHLSPSASSFPFNYWKTWWFQQALYEYTYILFLAWLELYICLTYFLTSYTNEWVLPGCCTEVEGSRDHGAGFSTPGQFLRNLLCFVDSLSCVLEMYLKFSSRIIMELIPELESVCLACYRM